MNKSKKSRLFVIVLLAIILIIPTIPKIMGAGYGEENESLGQFVDDYENDDNVSVAVNVINNQTLDCMELNTKVVLDYEKYTSYERIGEDTVLEINDYNVSFVQYHRGDEDSIYRVLGTNIGNFEFEFDAVISDVDAGDISNRDMINIFSVCNWIGDLQDQPIGTYDYINLGVRNNVDDDDKYRISFVIGKDGVQISPLQASALYAVSNDILYFRVNRTAGNVYVWWYSDSARTVLIESMSYLGGGMTDTFPYLYGVQAVDAVGDVGDWCSGSIAYLWEVGNYTGGYEFDGYFTTEDYLNYTQGQSLTLLTYASLPESTSLTAEFSQDNSTWLDNEGNVGGSNILAGFYALDLRLLNYTDFFIRYNFTGLVDSTPRLYQSRLITTEGPTLGVGDYSIIFLAIGLILMLAIAFLYNRDK